MDGGAVTGRDAPGSVLPQRLKWVKGIPAPEFPAECEPHSPQGPDGYSAWHAWAYKLRQTNVQRQCKGCGLWAIWEPKERG
jgi:hypothetical protein